MNKELLKGIMEGCSFQSELLPLFNSILPKATAFPANHGIRVPTLVVGRAACSVGVWRPIFNPLSVADFTWFKLGQVAELSWPPFPCL